MKKIFVDRHKITSNNNNQGRIYEPVILVETEDGEHHKCFGVEIRGESELVYDEKQLPGQYKTHVFLVTDSNIILKDKDNNRIKVL